MTSETESSGFSDVIALSVGAITGIAGTLALIHLLRTVPVDLGQTALVTTEAVDRQAKVMGLLDEASPAYWYVARAGGIVAYLLLWLSVFWGITMSSKMAKGVLAAPLVYGLHQFLPILAVLFSITHALVLLGDSYIQFRLWQLVVPFASPYEPLWTGLGVIAIYLLVALVASHYIRNHIGVKAWRLFHYTAYAAFLLALVHGVQSGTDSGAIIMQLVYVATSALILFATWYRILSAQDERRRRSRSTVQGATGRATRSIDRQT